MAESPGDVFAAELQATRRRRGWTQQELADRVTALGVPMNRPTIAKIETRKRERSVTVDELFAFAVALGVSPLALVLPRSEGQVQVTPTLTEGTAFATWWARNMVPLTVDQDVRFFLDARPDWESEALRNFPGLWAIYGAVGRFAILDEHHMPSPEALKALRDGFNAFFDQAEASLQEHYEIERLEREMERKQVERDRERKQIEMERKASKPAKRPARKAKP